VRRLALTTRGRVLERRLSTLQRRQFAAVFAAMGARNETVWRSVMRRLARDELAKSGRELP
jgi:hypothetical protein